MTDKTMRQKARAVIGKKTAARRAHILQVKTENPNLTATEVGKIVGCHENTVYNHLRVLKKEGKL